MEFAEAVAWDLVNSGVGTLYASSGTSIQVNIRRATGATTVVLLKQTGGVAYPLDTKEQQGLQCYVDSTTVSGAQTIARTVFNQLHERTAEVISGHSILWLRAIAPPQAVPMGPTESKGYQFTVNFAAVLVKS